MAEDGVEDVLLQLGESGTRVLDAVRTPAHEPLWRRDARLYRAFGKELIGEGHYTHAFELVREGLAHHEGDPELLFCRALALARGRNLAKAEEYVGELLQLPGLDDHTKVESLSLAGRVQKDRYERAKSEGERLATARASASLYEQAAGLSKGDFPAVNAATMWLLAGDPARARYLANRVVEGRAASGEASPEHEHWRQASLAEAYAILGHWSEAEAHYRLAAEAARARLGDRASMRRNLRLLQSATSVPRDVLDLFDLGPVVAFVGHMIDRPDREVPRFPPEAELEDRVGQAIERELDDLRPAVGYCSAACGADILFAERMLRRGAELHVVLPFDREDFYATSVDFRQSRMAPWRARCDAVLRRATDVHYATRESFLGDLLLFELGNEFIQGLALLRAEELGVEACAVAVLDPSSSALAGGTAQFVEAWRARGAGARVLDLSALRGGEEAEATPAPHPAPSAAGRREVKAMLFGDVKNFSKLKEEQAPSFFVTFLEQVAGVIEASKAPPVFRNTWGDGLFLVFDRVRDCADFALRLLERIAAVDFTKVGLPADTTVRIGVHAGPVYRHRDPVIGRDNFFGSHVNRAARIEPVTTPGCAYASEQFAALLANEADGGFRLEYVGVEDLAKGYDRCALYRVARR